MFLLTVIVAVVRVEMAEPGPGKAGRDDVAAMFRSYVEGLRRTPSVDTVPAWMEAEDDDDG